MPDESLDSAARDHLRAFREAVLLADEVAHSIRFILDSATARVVFPATAAIVSAREHVLFVPEEQPEDEDELQLLLAATSLDPDHDEACDRWRAYHGDPHLPRWLACAVESARFRGEVIEVDRLNQPNRLAAWEPALCRMLNADRPRLSALCRRRVGVSVREPLAVGVDDTGIDIRARFGIVRIRFPEPAERRDAAEAAIGALLEQAQ